MKQAETKAELQTIYSILKSDDEIKSYLIDHLTDYQFGYEPMVIAFRIIEDLYIDSDILPTLETFLLNPNVTDNIRMLLETPTNTAITTIDDAKHLVSILERYRKVRKIYETMVVVTNQMQDDKPTNLDEIVRLMESAVDDLQNRENVSYQLFTEEPELDLTGAPRVLRNIVEATARAYSCPIAEPLLVVLPVITSPIGGAIRVQWFNKSEGGRGITNI